MVHAEGILIMSDSQLSVHVVCIRVIDAWWQRSFN